MKLEKVVHNVQGGPAEMTRLCIHIAQSIFEIFLHLILLLKDILL